MYGIPDADLKQLVTRKVRMISVPAYVVWLLGDKLDPFSKKRSWNICIRNAEFLFIE